MFFFMANTKLVNDANWYSREKQHPEGCPQNLVDYGLVREGTLSRCLAAWSLNLVLISNSNVVPESLFAAKSISLYVFGIGVCLWLEWLCLVVLDAHCVRLLLRSKRRPTQEKEIHLHIRTFSEVLALYLTKTHTCELILALYSFCKLRWWCSSKCCSVFPFYLLNVLPVRKCTNWTMKKESK